MKPLPNQMCLETVIDHLPVRATVHSIQEDTHKPAGVRLAKMLTQYEARPSSELWSSIQSLAREILR
ncbi:hypothetical protein D3C80_2008120 [compost metagenome]